MRNIIILLTSFFTLFSISCIAQTISPANSDFENGDYSNWIFYWGTCCTGTGLGTMTIDSLTTTPPAGPFIPCSFALTGPAPATGFVSITGIDPFGGFPVVGAGTYSLRIGSERPNFWANRADYYIHIPATATHFNIIYRYAVVLEDPGHSPSKQPRFDVTATDSNSNTIVPCANFHYVAGALPGFVGPVSNAFAPVIGIGCPGVGVSSTPINMWDSDVYYKPWATASINVSGYAGHTIIMSFAAGDCGFGGHFGYAYIDMSSGLYGVTGNINCASSTMQLIAPTGFASYQWYDSTTFTTLFGTTDTLNIPAPSTTTGYAVIVTPYPGYGCTDTLYTTVHPFSAADTISGRTKVCVGDTETLSDPLYGGTWSSSTAVATITPGPSGGEVVTGITAGTSVLTYQLPIGCFVTKTVTVLPTPAPIKDDFICVGSTITLSDPTTGGVWSSGNNAIATMTATGIVTGVSGGIDTISYTIDSCCSAMATITVLSMPVAGIIAGPSSLCAGSTITLSDTQGGGVWSSGSYSTATVTSAGVVTGVSMGTVAISYSVIDTCGTATAIKNISIIPNDTTFHNTDTNVCANVGSILLYGPSGYDSYLWSTGSTSSSIAVSSSGIYIDGASTTNCIKNIDTFNVIFKPMPQVSLGNDVSICPGDSVMLSSQESSGSFSWSTGSTNNTIVVYNEGTYALTVTENGCSTSDTIQIGILTVPTPHLGPDTILCKGDQLVLSVDSSQSVWSNGMTGTNITVTQSGTYWASVTNICGTGTDTIKADFEPCDITFPNAFTPNNDGKNDIARVVGYLGLYRNFSLSIYNRFGQRVFYTEDIYSGWDGTFNGIPSDLGVYFYMIYYTLEGKQHMMKGDLTLIR